MPPSTQSRAIENPPAYESFPFLRLPPELRRLVWNLTLPGPQIHKVVIRRCSLRVKNPYHRRWLAPHVQSPRRPIALKTCKESRAVAQETLTQFPQCQCTCTTHPHLSYFNRKTDILFVDPKSSRHRAESWDAPWVGFIQLAFNARFLNDHHVDWLEGSVKMLLRRPLVWKIYFTELKVDTETGHICRARKDLEHVYSPFTNDWTRNTGCISITEVEVVDDRETRDKRLGEITSRLSAELENSSFEVNLASAQACCIWHGDH